MAVDDVELLVVALRLVILVTEAELFLLLDVALDGADDDDNCPALPDFLLI